MMSKEYNPKEIEKKWQDIWEKESTFVATEDGSKPKFFALIEFPYPSGAGLHVGHARPFTAMDVVSRKKRLDGYNVLYPIGWDAFGLPTENYAIKTKIHPTIVTEQNIENFKRQAKSIGFSFDWTKEINTTDPNYYKWTQWIFLKFYEKGLAYKAEMPINWCKSCKIGLANEEVVNGACERCGGEIERRVKSQWMLKITEYADKLLEGLEHVNYIDRVKASQANWIGRSEGAEVEFAIAGKEDKLKVFTTRPDTLFGSTFMVLSPEHPIIKKYKNDIQNIDEVEKYQKEAGKKSEFERKEMAKDKSGVQLKGLKAINPATGKKIPVWIADYVLMTYGTGAIMAVPAHDTRDWEFAKKFELPIKQVVAPYFTSTEKDKPRDDAETIARDTVIIVLKHWEKDEILCLDWKKQGWHSFIIGGIENGEDVKTAALRELEEETGYYNIKSIRIGETEVHNEFYASHKGINRYAKVIPVYIELADGSKNEISEEEASIHDLHWIKVDKLREFINLDNNMYIYDLIMAPETPYVGEGKLINSDFLNGLSVNEAKKKMTSYLVEQGLGTLKVNFNLRDWVFSRQRYWGEPIPLVHCEKCGWVPVPVEQLPVTLPNVENYEPTDTGESPLANIRDWVETTCPKCGGYSERETDTMPNWAGSSWYFLRYTDSNNDKAFASEEKLKFWMPVDWYNGGMEHVTLHLLYSRFWHRFLYDLGLVPTPEPYQKRTAHGMILAENNEKMSKSKGNVVSPDDIIAEYGADTLRTYIMFIGAFDQAAAWSMQGVKGAKRFLDRVWRLQEFIVEEDGYSSQFESLMHQTIKKVSEDIEKMKFNTAIAAMMGLVNEFYDKGRVTKGEFRTFLLLLNPFASHMTEELWQILGFEGMLNGQSWPKWDESKIIEDVVEIGVQINGKVRGTIKIAKDATQSEASVAVGADEGLNKYLDSMTIIKEVYVAGKIYNIVVRKG